MNYLQRNDRRSKKVFLKIAVLCLAIVSIVLLSSSIADFSSKNLNFLAYPFWKIKSAAQANDFYLSAFIKSRIKLAQEIRTLENDLLRTELKLKSLELAIEENKSLKEILDRVDLSIVTPAFVLARPPQTNYDSLIIDQGKEKGIIIGKKVFFESILLGEVTEVFEKTSKVRLYSSSGRETSAFVERINLPVKAKGRGAGNFEAEVPKEAEVKEADYIVVAGVSQKLLGQIEFIENQPTKSFKRILFRFPINLNQLKWVTVEK